MAKNISKVYLLNVPLEDDMRNTLYFANASAQQTYFQNNISKTYNNVSYQSETRTFRCPDQIDTVRQYNYIMWQNTAYSNKWFYAFIKKMTYVSDGYTDVVFEVDPLQTFMFDIEVKPSFVEREHTNNDTVGANTLPEGLELGEYVINDTTVNFGPINNNDFVIVLDVSMVENEGTGQTLSWHFDTQPAPIPTFSPVVNGTPSAVIHLLLGYDQYNHRVNGYYDPNVVVDVYNNAGLSDAIVNAYIMPSSMIDTSYIYGGLHVSSTYRPANAQPVTKDAPNLAIFAGSYHQRDLGTNTFSKPGSLDGYVPRNGKLKTFPFVYFNISNNGGSSYQYRYEDFSSNPSFKMEGAFCPSGSIKAIPQNYKNIGSGENAYDYSVNATKLPILSWGSDSYTNWLTQNSVNMRMERQNMIMHSIGQGLSGLVQGGLTGGLAMGGASAIGGAIDIVKNEFKAKTNANLTPDQVHGNLNAGDLVWAKLRSQFTYLPMSIKAEYARCADDYFDAYGYQVNRMKTPNTNHRQNWWYTKTMNANIVGNVPNEEMNKIKEAYNNGLTFWRNPSNFLNYSVSNGIV